MKRWVILGAAAVAVVVAILLVPKGGGSTLAEAAERLEGQSMRLRLNMTLTAGDEAGSMARQFAHFLTNTGDVEVVDGDALIRTETAPATVSRSPATCSSTASPWT